MENQAGKIDQSAVFERWEDEAIDINKPSGKQTDL